MKFEELLSTHVGDWGRYQKTQILLVSIPTIFTAVHALSWTFRQAPPPVPSYSHRRQRVTVDVPPRCMAAGEETGSPYSPANLSLPLDAMECEQRSGWTLQDYAGSPNASLDETCSVYVYDHSEISRSAISEFDIVCGRGWIRAFIQSMYYVGQFFGSIFFGIMGDKFGRKPVFLGAILLQALSGAAMAVVPHWAAFAALRVSVGFCHPGIFVIAVVIGMELVGPEKRKVAGVITGTFYAVGQVLLGLVAYAIRDYGTLQLVISLPGLAFLAYYWVIPESARWLIAQKRHDEAGHILRNASKQNGLALPEDWHEQLDASDDKAKDGKAEGEPEEVRRSGPMQLILYGPTLRRILLMYVCWPVVSGVYYGLSMNPTFFGGHRYFTFIGAAFMEIPGLVLSFFTLDRWGRKFLVCLGYTTCSVLLFSTLIVPDSVKWINPIQVVLSKAAITLVYASIYTWTPELFPTAVRNTALGSCSMMARLGAISASYISMWLVDKSRVAVVLIFASASFVATLAALFLPETAGQPLPEHFEDIRHQKLSFLPLCCRKTPKKDAHDEEEAQQLNAMA